MHHHNEHENQEPKKKSHGFLKFLFKLITLGGFLMLIYKSVQKNKEKLDKED